MSTTIVSLNNGQQILQQSTLRFCLQQQFTTASKIPWKDAETLSERPAQVSSSSILMAKIKISTNSAIKMSLLLRNCKRSRNRAAFEGWSEPAATSAPVQDGAVQAVLGMNPKHILFPSPGIFKPLSLPQNFPLPFLPLTSLPHLISCSLHLESLGELLSLSSTELQRNMRQGLRKVKSSMLKKM